MDCVSSLKFGIPIALLSLASCAGTDSGESASAYDFVEFAWAETKPDPTGDRLCEESADPEGAPDKINIHCRMEGANLSDGAAPKDKIVVMTYNMERGVKLDDQLDWLLHHPDSPNPDIILVGEADRGCSRSGSRDVLYDAAEALGMYYLYGVEFVELPRPSGSGGQISETCEHGNGILSKYPLGNARLIRHAQNKSWYQPPGSSGEPRLGGRVTVAADAKIGDRILHLYSLHFESAPEDSFYRDAQAVELAEEGLGLPFTVIQAGDTNAPFYFLDLLNGTSNDTTTKQYFDRGYYDTHRDLPYDQRGTRGGFIIDLIFTLDENFSNPGRCPPEVCGGFSDHLPVWTTIDLTK